MPVHHSLPDFDEEMINTRKMLECVPEGHFDFQPHPKSARLDHLAGHVAESLAFAGHVMRVELLELQPGEMQPFVPKSRQELLERFDKNEHEAREALAKATDEQLDKVWTLKWMGESIINAPRRAVLRAGMMNHLIHHRAQLGLYLRLLNVAIPGMYGPSADEMPPADAKKNA